MRIHNREKHYTKCKSSDFYLRTLQICTFLIYDGCRKKRLVKFPFRRLRNTDDQQTEEAARSVIFSRRKRNTLAPLVIGCLGHVKILA